MAQPVREDLGTGSLWDGLIVVAKHSRMIVGVSAAVAVLTYLFLFALPNKYRAATRVLPPHKNLTISAQLLDSMSGGMSSMLKGTESGSLANIVSGFFGLRSPSELYVAIMKGDEIANCMIKRFDLENVYHAKGLEGARKQLRKFSRIYAGKEGLINAEVIATDPKLAAEMANAYVEEFDKLLRSLINKEAKERLLFLEKEQEISSANLSKAEDRLRAFGEEKSVLQIDSQTRGMLEYIANLRAAIDAKEVQIKVLRQQATPLNYDVIRSETEIKGLKEKLKEAEMQYGYSPVGEVCLPTSKVPALGLDYIRLLREVKFHEGLYQMYTKMVELARIDMMRDISLVNVVDPARPPEKRYNTRLIPALTTGILTFFLMIVVSFGIEYYHNMKDEDSQRLAILKSHLDFWINPIHRFFSSTKRRWANRKILKQ
jgi:capsule polysaccharide export protein KpsE/RkpR